MKGFKEYSLQDQNLVLLNAFHKKNYLNDKI